MSESLERIFSEVYAKFKVQFYKRIFHRFEAREASLTTVESFSVEIIHALGTPTISEFAKFLNISVANATYKVQNLEKKGYVRKERSSEDRRELHLYLTKRFFEYQELNQSYMTTVIDRIEKFCPPEDITVFQRVLERISTEFMTEVEV